MAKENREAEHMLGHNDPKQTPKKKKKKNKKRQKWKEHEYNKNTTMRASANKQLKQCFRQASLRTPMNSIAFVCWLCLHKTLLEREKKRNQLLKHGSLETITRTEQQVLSGDKTQKWVLSSINLQVEVNRYHYDVVWMEQNRSGALEGNMNCQGFG